MKALVTGAAGFIGSHLAEQLLNTGSHVTGLDCFTDYYDRSLKEANISLLLKKSGFEFVESKIEEANLPHLLEETTHVFHLAAQAGVRRSWGNDFGIYTACNIDATQALLEACIETSIQKFVYASSSSIYGDGVDLPMQETARPQPISPYGVTKLAAEHLCNLYHKSYNLPVVSLRYFTVYGPRQRPDMAFHRFLKAALNDAPINVYGDGNQTRDFTFVSDAVFATTEAGTKGVPGRVYNIGGGSRVSINSVLKMITECTGQQLNIRHQAPEKGDMRDTYADTSLAKSDLQFSPHVSLEEGLRSEHRWLESTSDLM